LRTPAMVILHDGSIEGTNDHVTRLTDGGEASTKHRVPSTEYSVLSTQYSVLNGLGGKAMSENELDETKPKMNRKR
jgi:hypothetical protein